MPDRQTAARTRQPTHRASHDAPTSARAGNRPGAALPAPLLHGIQRLSGLDLSDVTVHANSPRPAQLGAQAFAQGDHIHLAPGQQRHLPHEAWHVVQQRQGRVAPGRQAWQGQPGWQAKGAAINDQPALEQEADQMGSRAAQLGQQAVGPATLRAAGCDAASTDGAPALPQATARSARAAQPAAVIQRNVGMEVETSKYWQVWTADGGPDQAPRPVAKGTPIVHRPHFQMQAEFAGDAASNLEMVTNPPGSISRTEYEACRDGMITLGQEMEALQGHKPFNAAELTGGDPRFTIQPGVADQGLGAHLQVTVGVPLASVPALFKHLEDEGVEAPFKLGNTATQTQQAIAPGVATALGQAQISPELLGFITLIEQTLKEGGGDPNANKAQRATFPKAVFTLLARTDFKRMFDLLPPNDQTAISNHLDAWVSAVLNKPNGAFAPDQPVMKQTFLDPESKAPASTIDTSRADWLANLPERDLLSYHGKQDAALAPRPSGKARTPLRTEAKKAAVDVSLAPGQANVSDARAPLDVPLNRNLMRKLVHDLKDLYQGMGGLGNKVDTVAVHSLPGQVGPSVSQAVILEIRKGPSLSGKAALWRDGMDPVYNAVERAIAYPQGRPAAPQKAHFWSKQPAPLPQRSYTSVLSDKQQQQRQALDLLRTTLLQLNADAQQDGLPLATHQARVGQALKGGG